MSERIRWERNDDGSHVTPAYEGYAGTISEPQFFIFEPDDRDPWWILASQLPGLAGPGRAERRAHGDDTDKLKDLAERWLEEFVSSLGAVFPRNAAPKSGRAGILAAVMGVACSQCGAGQHENCISGTGRTRFPPGESHSARVEMAKRVRVAPSRETPAEGG